MRVRALFASLAVAGCSDDAETSIGDAPTVQPMLMISGRVEAHTAGGSQPLAGVAIGAYRNGVDGPAAITGTSDANGDYALVFETGGVALDGYLKATMSTYLDTYLYPPRPVTTDFTHARIAMLTADSLSLLSDTLCGATQQAGNAAIIAIVADAADQPVAGATVGSSPAAAKYCYNIGGFPNRNASSTDGDGIAYYLDVPAGRVAVTAIKAGLTLPSHSLLALPDVLTTTLIIP